MSVDQTEELRNAVGGAAALSLLAAVGLIGYGSYVWLRLGHWPVITASSVWASWSATSIQTGWAGVQKIIDFIMELQLWLVAAVASAVLGWLAGIIPK